MQLPSWIFKVLNRDVKLSQTYGDSYTEIAVKEKVIFFFTNRNSLKQFSFIVWASVLWGFRIWKSGVIHLQSQADDFYAQWSLNQYQTVDYGYTFLFKMGPGEIVLDVKLSLEIILYQKELQIECYHFPFSAWIHWESLFWWHWSVKLNLW